MTSYIHYVKNESAGDVLAVVLSPELDMSFDLVLGAGNHVQYDELLGAGAVAVPRAEDAATFADNRIKLRVGGSWFSIYECGGKVRCKAGDDFDKDAPEIPGRSGYPTIALVVDKDGKPQTEVYKMLSGTGLAHASWVTVAQGLYGVGDNHNLIEKLASSGVDYGPWRDMGAPPAGLAGPMSAVSWVAQRYSIYVLGLDGIMYERAWLTSRWENWIIHTPPRDTSIKGIASVSWVAGQYAVYVTTDTGDLFEKYWKLDHWEDWGTLGQPSTARLLGPVTAVCWSGSRYGVYALGDDGNVWQKWWATSWSGWDSIGAPEGVSLVSLASVCMDDRIYVVAAVGSDKNLWVRRYKHGWYDWEKIGAPASGLAGAVTAGYDGNAYTYYALGEDGVLYMFKKGAWAEVNAS